MSRPYPVVDRFRLTQPFADPGSYATVRDGHGPAGHHSGADYAGPVPGPGYAVRSCTTGVVVISDRNATMGNWVGVYCAHHDVLLTYWHLEARLVRVGQTVRQGQTIGRLGSTGNSTAPHVHVQANRGRVFSYRGHINPAPWVATTHEQEGPKMPPTYLETHPPARRQFRPRQSRVTGAIVVHSAESAPDLQGADTGAEGVASFIQRRADPGSYHDLVDSDSAVPLVPYAMAAYGDGTGSNEWALHLSFATQAHRWDGLPEEWVEGALRQAAKRAANMARWVKATRGITIPARRISRADSERGVPGFISHAERDPARRSDPGQDFPWTRFLAYYADEMNGEDHMSPEQEKRLNDRLTALEDRLTDPDGRLVRRVADRVVNSPLVEMGDDPKTGKPRNRWSLGTLLRTLANRRG